MTPARKVVHHAEIFVGPDPLPDDHCFPVIATALSNPANIFPNQSFDGNYTAARLFMRDPE
jgi:hypothetical protein